MKFKTIDDNDATILRQARKVLKKLNNRFNKFDWDNEADEQKFYRMEYELSKFGVKLEMDDGILALEV